MVRRVGVKGLAWPVQPRFPGSRHPFQMTAGEKLTRPSAGPNASNRFSNYRGVIRPVKAGNRSRCLFAAEPAVRSRVIRVDDEVYERLKGMAEPFSDTPNRVLRRVLELDPPEPGTRDEG